MALEVDYIGVYDINIYEDPPHAGRISGIAYYNPLTGEFDATVPPTVPLGGLIGARVFYLNTSEFEQYMILDALILHPDGVEEALPGWTWRLPVGGEGYQDILDINGALLVGNKAGPWYATLILLAEVV